MPIGTTAALLIGAGIASGTQLAGAKMASGAAKDASKIQSEAGREALALQRQMYEQGRQDALPWLRTGQEAITTLGALSGLGGGGGGLGGQTGMLSPTTADKNAGQPVAYRGPGGTSLKPISSDPSVPTPDLQFRRDQGGVYAMPLGMLGAGQQFQTPAQAATSSSYVQLKAPTGEVGQVPADQVAHYLAQGATRV